MRKAVTHRTVVAPSAFKLDFMLQGQDTEGKYRRNGRLLLRVCKLLTSQPRNKQGIETLWPWSLKTSGQGLLSELYR